MECVDSFACATHDYEMPGKGFLPLKANDVLHVIEADPSGWWLGKNLSGAKGVFPSTYTRPFLFRYPSETVQRMLAHLRRANDFHVDLVSGVPRPLCQVESAQHLAPPTELSLDDMYTATNESVLRRETVRSVVRDRLAHLMDVEHAVYAAASPSLRSGCGGAVASGDSSPTANTPEIRDEDDQMEKTLALIADMRSEALPSGRVPLPSAAWYRRYHRVLKDTTDQRQQTKAATLPCPPAELQLQDLQKRVAVLEASLETLAPELKHREQQYLEERESLRRRISVRDDLVSRYLAHWAQAAEQRRANYLQAKATNQCTEVAAKSEEAHLRQCVQEGKETYLALSEEWKALNVRAKVLRTRLMEKTVLQELEDRIQSANEAIAALRRRQRNTVLHAQ